MGKCPGRAVESVQYFLHPGEAATLLTINAVNEAADEAQRTEVCPVNTHLFYTVSMYDTCSCVFRWEGEHYLKSMIRYEPFIWLQP